MKILTYCLLAIACLFLGGTSYAQPKLSTLALPDGSSIVFASDSKFNVFAPSTTTRLAFHCADKCTHVEADTSGAAILSGVWGAVGQAVRRPDKYISTIQNGNSIASTTSSTGGSTAPISVAGSTNALTNTQGDQTNAQLQGQLAFGGAGGSVTGSGNSAVVGSGNSSAISAPIVAPVIAPLIAPVNTNVNTPTALGGTSNIIGSANSEATGTQTCSGLGCSNN